MSVMSTSCAMCTTTVCFLSLSTTSSGLDSLIEQTDGLHLNLFGLRLSFFLTADQMCAWYVAFKGRNLGVYSTWAKCSEEILGYKEAMHFGDWIGCSKTLFTYYVPAMRLVFPALESMLKSLAKPKSEILGFIFESMLKSLAKPKSEILGFIFASSRMLLALRSR